MLNRIMNDESGVLTFEWILLITLLVIGIVGGLAIMRDALIVEAAETADAVMAFDQSYTIVGSVEPKITDTGAGVATITGYNASHGGASAYTDAKGSASVSVPTSVVPGTPDPGT